MSHAALRLILDSFLSLGTHDFRRLFVAEKLPISPLTDTVSLVHADVNALRAERKTYGLDHLWDNFQSVPEHKGTA